MTQRFVFEFSKWIKDDEHLLTRFGFEILESSAEAQAWLETIKNDGADDEYFEFLGDMEDYGVHDFCTVGEYEAVGFSSYEVESEKYMEVMEKWHKFFADHGLGVGPITQLDENYDFGQPSI